MCFAESRQHSEPIHLPHIFVGMMNIIHSNALFTAPWGNNGIEPVLERLLRSCPSPNLYHSQQHLGAGVSLEILHHNSILELAQSQCWCCILSNLVLGNL